jgi:hypothetical protein
VPLPVSWRLELFVHSDEGFRDLDDAFVLVHGCLTYQSVSLLFGASAEHKSI